METASEERQDLDDAADAARIPKDNTNITKKKHHTTPHRKHEIMARAMIRKQTKNE